MSLKERVAELVAAALAEAERKALLPPPGEDLEIVAERPQNPQHGDMAVSLPLKLARSLRMNPYQIAQTLAALVPLSEEFERVEAVPPGFLNFFAHPAWVRKQVDAILRAGARYGSLEIGGGQRIQVEFVSVNPTGPIHVGHARGAVLGSTLASVLKAAGYEVTREYYVNDAGSQMAAFYRSLYTRYRQVLGQEAEMPADGYAGSYLVDLAREIARDDWDKFLHLPEPQAVQELGEMGLRRMLEAIRDDLRGIRVEFDIWFRERSLYETGQYQETLLLLKSHGYVTEREGARWFTSTALGDEKDNVLVRSTGEPTYFASDIAYHRNKFLGRRFDRVINIWGADHQGHVSRMKAAVAAMGVDPSKLDIIIAQLVTLKRRGEAVRVSKRTGELVTLRELVEEVGPDACRYFFLARSAEAQMEFDLELAKERSRENPVYYIQYAYARIAGILRLARERDLNFSDGDVQLLQSPDEMELIRRLILFPELIESMARSLEPHHLPHYALELANAFHWFYDRCRVITDDLPLTRARLKLADATRIVLSQALSLMGMDAPERM